MKPGYAFVAVVFLLVLLHTLLGAISPERALRLGLWEMNLPLRLNRLRVSPESGNVEEYVAKRRVRTRIGGIIGTLACLAMAAYVLRRW